VALLLEELYGVTNATTGSLFKGFALQSEEEKDQALTDLVELFIAADKVSANPHRNTMC
jgi:histone acetyltransferase HTATIP